MLPDHFGYQHIYSGLRSHLINEGVQDTKKITESIKRFFCLLSSMES